MTRKRFIQITRAGIVALILGVLPPAGGVSTAFSQGSLEEARAALPKEIRDAGVLKVATNFSWPPFVYKSEKDEPIGIEVSLLKLLASKLGLRPEFDDLKFPAIIPGVQSGRYDVGVNQLNITAERLKVLDFLPYFDSGYGILVRKGVTDIDIKNLCGRTFVITQGSIYAVMIQEMSAKCVASGKPEIGIQTYPNTADTLLALGNGRGDAFITARAVGMYIARTNPRLDLAQGVLEGRHDLVGIMIHKGSGLRSALLLALESCVKDGSYKALLDEFGVAEGAISPEEMRSRPAL